MKYAAILVAVALLAAGCSEDNDDNMTGPQPDPVIQVIHNSPSAAAAVVDIYLNGGASPAVDDLAFRTATGLIELEPGSYTIGIAPGNSAGPGDVIANFGPVQLAAGSETVVMAAGELGDDFDLFFNQLKAAATAGNVGLLAFHGSPDAPTVDISAFGVGILVTALQYQTFQGYIEVPEADYTLGIAPTGDDPIIYFDVPLTGLGGGTAVAFASGYLGARDTEFGLFAALNDGTVVEFEETFDPGDAIIQVIHNSPSVGAAVVDVYLNGGASPAIDDFAFQTATGLIPLPAGPYTIGIAPGNSTGPGDIIASFGPVTLAEGSQTVIMAAGELGTDFGLFFNDLVTSATAGQVGLLAFHGSPDAPTVDISADGVGVLVTALEYLTFQGYIEVPEADYTLGIGPTGDDPIIEFDVPLTGLGGGTAVAFASGYLGARDTEFGLLAALNDGTVVAFAVAP